MKFFGLLIGVSIPLLAADFPKDAPTKDIDKIQGTWVILSVETNGSLVRGDNRQDAAGELTLNGNQYTLKLGEIVNTGTFRLDSERTPKAVDVIPGDGPNRGRTFPGIYTIEGDIMKSCFNVGGGKRPTEFATQGHPDFVVVQQKHIRYSE